MSERTQTRSPIIVADNLEKTFFRGRGRKAVQIPAVKPLSLTVEPGEFIGFLGPNGAGKSTTIKMLIGILEPSGGTVHVDGLIPAKHRVHLALRLGVVFGQRTQLWWDLPLLESYRLLKVMYRVNEADYRRQMETLVELLDLSSFWHTPVRQLSLGQRMRGELAAALLHRPKILVLDEPTIGLDVTAKSDVRRFLLRENRERRTTIVLTTHDMSDVEELCTRIVVINQGIKMFDGTVNHLEERTGALSALHVTFQTTPLWDAINLPGIEHLSSDDDRSVLLHYNRRQFTPPQILEQIREAGRIEDFRMEEPRLELIMRTLYEGDGRLGE